MKIIIVGYGRVGTQVLRLLGTKNHSIIILDKNRAVLERTVEQTGVKVLIGDATDPDLLRQAGAESADVLLALTRDENTNLMVAQIARVVFKVPKVMALVYEDSALAEDCWAADVVVAINPVRRTCPAARVIDRFDLWREGGHALWLDRDEVRIETVNGERGERPWVPRPEPRARKSRRDGR